MYFNKTVLKRNAPVVAIRSRDIPEKMVPTLRNAAPTTFCIHEQEMTVAFRINQNRVPLQRGKRCFQQSFLSAGNFEGRSRPDQARESVVKPKEELQDVIEQIRSEQSPVGMDAVYVHALILDQLASLDSRLQEIESRLGSG